MDFDASIVYDDSATLTCRLFNPSDGTWYTGSGWTATEASAQESALTETALADPSQSRYTVTVTVPEGSYVMEYLEGNDVVAEEFIIDIPSGTSWPASLVYDKSSTVTCRVFEPSTKMWWTGSSWTSTEASAQSNTLTAKSLSDSANDRYYRTIDLSAVPEGSYTLEYIESTEVIAEEPISLAVATTTTAAPTNTWVHTDHYHRVQWTYDTVAPDNPTPDSYVQSGNKRRI